MTTNGSRRAINGTFLCATTIRIEGYLLLNMLNGSGGIGGGGSGGVGDVDGGSVAGGGSLPYPIVDDEYRCEGVGGVDVG